MEFVHSDMHFNHARVLGYSRSHFKNVEEMNQHLVDEWNKVVSDGDIVYHIGDFMFSKEDKWTSQLNGKIIFIKGNHDKMSFTNIQQMVINYKGVDILLIHNPSDAANSPFKFVIHGHVHKGSSRTYTAKPGKRYYNACCEFHKYRPVSLDQALGDLKKDATK